MRLRQATSTVLNDTFHRTKGDGKPSSFIMQGDKQVYFAKNQERV